MQLAALPLGKKAKIIKVLSTDKAYQHKLLVMGLIPGTFIKLIRMAPFGDPIEIEVRGFSLSLRKSEAAILEIEEVEDACNG